MPNLPETFAAFFAILKVGAIVMPLFSGFGTSPIQWRLNHGEAKAVITANGTWRRGAAPLKSVVDEALRAVPSVRRLIGQHKVTYLGVSPTIVRGLMCYGDKVENHELSSLRVTASGGEARTETPWLDRAVRRKGRLPLL